MNISILSTFDLFGGAAIAARRLCKGLLQLKQDAVMIVKEKQSSDPYIYKMQVTPPQYEVEKRIFQNIQYAEIDRDRTERSNTRFSFPYPGYDLSHTPVIANTEIINPHWVVGFQSVETIAALLKSGKPVVWTLHDENSYTGGCHYAAGCQKYREDCSDCLQLKDNPYQIPYHVLKNKINSWEHKNDLTIVTPSQWLAACAKKSRIFKDLKIEVIPNSLETDIFKPKAKALAKKEMGLAPQSLTLLFGAATGNEKRKGFYKLMAAVKYCLQDETFKHLAKKGEIKILTFGPPQEDLEQLEIEIKSLGYVNNNEQLADIYSAADIFVLPSLEDNLPNTVLEAMACGTPVIGFQVGGMPDMIQDGITGYMAPPFDSHKLGDLILKLLFDEDKRKQMKLNCRQLIEKKFKLQDQAEGYLDLFQQLSANRKTISPSETSEDIKLDNKGGEISLRQWKSDVHRDFFDLYRKWALQLLIKRKPLKNNRFIKFIKWPLKKARRIFRLLRRIVEIF
jgi:glycosyltransferase involved in cell wall biosynthesis